MRSPKQSCQLLPYHPLLELHEHLVPCSAWPWSLWLPLKLPAPHRHSRPVQLGKSIQVSRDTSASQIHGRCSCLNSPSHSAVESVAGVSSTKASMLDLKTPRGSALSSLLQCLTTLTAKDKELQCASNSRLDVGACRCWG